MSACAKCGVCCARQAPVTLRECGECSALFCEICWAATHTHGALLDHRVLCARCHIRDASMGCAHCFGSLCKHCWPKVHCFGSLAFHTPTPLNESSSDDDDNDDDDDDEVSVVTIEAKSASSSSSPQRRRRSNRVLMSQSSPNVSHRVAFDADADEKSSTVSSPRKKTSKISAERASKSHSVSSSSSVDQTVEDQSFHLLALRLTVHSAEGLKEKSYPYVAGYYRRQKSSERVLLFRTPPLLERTSNPVWNMVISEPCMRSSDVLELEVRDSHRASRGPLLGRCCISFPDKPGPFQVSSLRIPLLGKDGPWDRRLLVVSYETSAPLLQRGQEAAQFLTGSEETDILYESVPAFEQHVLSYGVILPNFRDLGGWPCRYRDRGSGRLCQARVRTRLCFRTSAIHRASERDAQLITEQLGVRTLIDLRTPDCAGNRGPFLTGCYAVLKPKDRAGHWTSSDSRVNILPEDYQNTLLVSAAQRHGVDGRRPLLVEQQQALLAGVEFDHERETIACMQDAASHRSCSKARASDWGGRLYLCSLVGPSFQLAIVRRSSKRRVLTAGLVAETPQEQKRLLCGPIFDGPDGLEVLYRLMVKHCRNEFAMVFQTVLDNAAQPFAFFCNHGKDRTGLTAAFLLTLLGVARSTIAHNYMLSEYLLRPIQNVVDFEMTDAGMLPAVMSRTPEDTMWRTLDYIDHKYGGVERYLHGSGFSYQQQAALRALLLDDVAELPERAEFRSGTLRIHGIDQLVAKKLVSVTLNVKIGSSRPVGLLSDVLFSVPKRKLRKGSEPVVLDATVALPSLEPSSKIVFELVLHKMRDRVVGCAELELDLAAEPFANRRVSLPIVETPLLKTRHLRLIHAFLAVSLEFD